MNTCTVCHELKEEECFALKGRSGKRREICRVCVKDRDKAYYQANKEKTKQRTAARVVEIRKYIYDYLSTHPCVDCGESDIVVLEFDHVRGEKVSNVSSLVPNHASNAKIDAEIAKCEIRCCNCHRRVTAKRGNWKVLDHLPAL